MLITYSKHKIKIHVTIDTITRRRRDPILGPREYESSVQATRPIHTTPKTVTFYRDITECNST
jgi:hypothetical protein